MISKRNRSRQTFRRVIQRNLDKAGRFIGRRDPKTLLALAAAVGAVQAMFHGAQAKAATYYWDTNGADGFGSVTGGWDGTNAFWNDDSTGATTGNTVASPSLADDLILSAGTAGTITITGTGTGSSLTLSSDAANIITGGTLALGGSGASSGLFVTNAVTAATAVSSAITINNSVNTIQNAGTGILTISGGITGAQNLILQNNGATAGGITISTGAINHAGTLTNSGTGTGGVTINSVIGSNVTGVTQNSSSSTLTLAAANTFTGPVTITSGTLIASATGALGSASSTAVNGTLNLTTAPNGNITPTGLSTVTGSGTINVSLYSANAANTNNTATVSLNGNYSNFTGVINVGVSQGLSSGKMQMTGADNAAMTVNVTANSTVYVGGGGTHNAAITLNGGDTGESLGQLRLEGNSTWAGSVTLAGSMSGTSDGYIGSNSGTGYISGSIGETGGSKTLSMSGGQTVILSGANTYTGGTNLISGTLGISSDTAGAYNLGTGTSGITFSGGALRIIGTAMNNFGSHPITVTSGKVLSMDINTAGNTFTFNDAISNAAGGITKNGAGTLILGGKITSTGTITTTAGTLNLNGSGNTAKTITMNGGTLDIGANGITVSDVGGYGLTGSGGTINATGGGQLILGSDGGATNGLDFGATNSATITVNAVISGSHPLDIYNVANGTGILVLNGNNTYTGQTDIQAGVVQVSAIGNTGSSGNLGTNGTIAFSTNTTTAAALRYTGTGEVTNRVITLASGTGQAGSLDASGSSGTIEFSSNLSNPGAAASNQAKTLNLIGTGQGKFSGNLVNASAGTSGQLALSVTKSGAGTWTLSGTNTYSGGTALSAGTLNLNSASALGTGALTVSGGGVDNTSGSAKSLANQFIFSANFAAFSAGDTNASNLAFTTASTSTTSLTKTITVNGTGTTLDVGQMVWTNNNDAANTLTVNGAGNTLVIGALTLDSAGTTARNQTINGTGNLTINGAVVNGGSTGAQSLIYAGSGTLSLGSSNTYTGATAVNSGTLDFTGGASSGSTSLFVHGTVASPATAKIESGASVTIGGNIAIAQATGDTKGSLTINGGTLAQTGSASYFTIGDNNTAAGGTAVGSVTQSGGVVNVGTSGTAIAYFSVGAAGTGTYTLSGGTINSYTTAGFNIGDRASSTGTMTVSGTGVLNILSADGLYIAKGANSSSNNTKGTLTMDGGSVNTPKITFGNGSSTSGSAVGTINLNGGTLTVGTGGITKAGSQTNPTIRFNGGTLKSAGAFAIGGSIVMNVDTGGAFVDTTGGNITSSSAFLLGNGAGNVTVSGSNTLTLPGTNSYTGFTTIMGGATLKLGASTLPNYVAVGSGSTFDLNNASSTVAGLNNVAGVGGTVTNSGATAQTLTLNGTNTYTFAGVITGTTPANTKLTVAMGAGSQTLTSANTYTGATTVTSGKLLLGNGGSLGATAVTVGAGTFGVSQTVSGTSNSIGGSLTMNAGSAFTMADGFTSTLNVTGAANLFATAGTAPVYTFDIGSTSGVNDRLAVGGAATLSQSGAKVSINPLGALTVGNTYMLVTGGASSTLGTNGLSLLNSRVVFGTTAYGLTLANTAGTSTLTVSTAGAASAYWTGAAGTAWNSGAGNWNTDATSGVTAAVPNSVSDVYFATTTPPAGNLSNTLGANTTIRSLNFTADSGAVTIGGANTLTITPEVSTLGISNASSNAQTISTAVTLGAAQTWTNNGGLLSVGAVTAGANSLTLAGTGAVTLGSLNSTGAVNFSQTGAINITGNVTGTATLTTSGGPLTLGGATNTVKTLNVNSTSIVDIGSGSLVLNNGGSFALTSSTGGTINATGGGSITLSGTGSTGSGLGDNYVAPGKTLTVNARLTGNVGFEVWNSTGTFVFGNANNDFTGDVVFSAAGTISVAGMGAAGAAGYLGKGTNIYFSSAGTLLYTGAGESTNRVIQLSGGANIGGIVDASGTTSSESPLKFTANVVNAASANGTNVLTVQGTGFGEIAGSLANKSGTILTGVTKAGAGTWTLSGANTFTGNVTVSNGALVITNSSALGTGTKTVSIVGATGTTAPELHLDGSAGAINLPSTMSFTTSQVTTAAISNEAGDNTIAGNFSLTGGNGATNIKSNAGTLTLAGNFSISSGQGPRPLTLQGGGDGTVSGNIQTNGSTNALTLYKEGSGTWTLTGANTYTGATTISGGKLVINGDNSAATGAVNVGNTATLGGTGTIGGAVTVQSGGHLAPGNSPGALIINNTLTLNSGSTSDFEIASTSSYDQVTGLTGLSYGGTLNVTGTIASSAHTYTLFSLSSGSAGGTFDTVNLASAPTGYRWHDYDALTAGIQGFDYTTGQIKLEVANSAAVKLGLVANALSGSIRSDTTDENDENGMNAVGSIHVTGSNGRFVSEIDGLTNEAGVHDFADGYVQVDNDLSPAPTLVMLWLKDNDGVGTGIEKSDVISALVANAGGAYTVLTSSDPEWQKLAGAYSGFDTIIDFGSVMGTGDAFSWKFQGDYAAITVDKVAVVPEPGSLGLLGLGALGLMGSRRRKSKKVAGESALSRFYNRRRSA